MDKIVEELAAQFPVAVLLLIVVWRFLVYMDKASKDAKTERDEQTKNWLETVRNRDHHFLNELQKHEDAEAAQHKEAMSVYRETATMIGQTRQVMERVDTRLTNDEIARRSRP